MTVENGRETMARWTAVAALVLAMGAVVPAWAGVVEDCGNGETLVKTEPARVVAACRHLADQGDYMAQTNLGAMYYYGQGVPQDYAEAMRWFRKAADLGFDEAQNNIGSMYANGQGAPRDYVQAYMWWSLAAAQGDANAAKDRDIVAARMTAAQIEQGKALVAAWKPTTAAQ
jgi:TPR repeat protein